MFSKSGNGNWTRSNYNTVTVDTRGINAGRPEGRAALEAAQNVQRRSEAMGTSATGSEAQAFNRLATTVSKQVNSVSSAHRSEAAQSAQADKFVRDLVASRYGR